jgi:hypothetical protein
LSASPLIYQGGAYKYDFSTDSSQVYGGTATCKLLAPNVWGIPAGDINADGFIGAEDKSAWETDAGTHVYSPCDANLDSEVNLLDVNDFLLMNFPYSCQVPE